MQYLYSLLIQIHCNICVVFKIQKSCIYPSVIHIRRFCKCNVSLPIIKKIPMHYFATFVFVSNKSKKLHPSILYLRIFESYY